MPNPKSEFLLLGVLDCAEDFHSSPNLFKNKWKLEQRSHPRFLPHQWATHEQGLTMDDNHGNA